MKFHLILFCLLFFIEHLSNTNDSYDSIKPIIMGKIATST
jgi:hypothetical protein